MKTTDEIGAKKIEATHLIKVELKFDKNKWTEKSLKEFVDKKMEGINPLCFPDLDLFRVKDDTLNVCLFISFLAGVKTTGKLAKEWLEGHIKEQGIKIEKIEVKAMMDFISKIQGLNFEYKSRNFFY
ncbi:hypothetical protein KAS79_00375 [Candidatus Parcubacteria bacterium]|nr:hypothetical protein [Candidatus Parcubacteria bacterium]